MDSGPVAGYETCLRRNYEGLGANGSGWPPCGPLTRVGFSLGGESDLTPGPFPAGKGSPCGDQSRLGPREDALPLSACGPPLRRGDADSRFRGNDELYKGLL